MKDKRILSGRTAYVFTKYNDGIKMTDWQGFTTCAEDIMELCNGLMKYAFKHKSEIDVYNQKRMIELEEELNGCVETAKKENRTMNGEWYEFSESELQWVSEAISELKEDHNHE